MGLAGPTCLSYFMQFDRTYILLLSSHNSFITLKQITRLIKMLMSVIRV